MTPELALVDRTRTLLRNEWSVESVVAELESCGTTRADALAIVIVSRALNRHAQSHRTQERDRPLRMRATPAVIE